MIVQGHTKLSKALVAHKNKKQQQARNNKRAKQDTGAREERPCRTEFRPEKDGFAASSIELLLQLLDYYKLLRRRNSKQDGDCYSLLLLVRW